MDVSFSEPLVSRLPGRKRAHGARPARHHRGSPVVKQCGNLPVNRADRCSLRPLLQVCVMQGLERVSSAVKTV